MSWRDLRDAQFDSCMRRRGVTAAEMGVARLIAWGLSDNKIASKIKRSLSTVKRHEESLFAKFAVHSRSDLAEIVRLEMGDADR